jgi:hypothetical protein
MNPMVDTSQNDRVQDGRHLMQQGERRVEWWPARNAPTRMETGDVLHVWPGRGRIGIETLFPREWEQRTGEPPA